MLDNLSNKVIYPSETYEVRLSDTIVLAAILFAIGWDFWTWGVSVGLYLNVPWAAAIGFMHSAIGWRTTSMRAIRALDSALELLRLTRAVSGAVKTPQGTRPSNANDVCQLLECGHTRASHGDDGKCRTEVKRFGGRGFSPCPCQQFYHEPDHLRPSIPDSEMEPLLGKRKS